MRRVVVGVLGSLLASSACGARSELAPSEATARVAGAGRGGQGGAATVLAGTGGAGTVGSEVTGAAPSTAGSAAAGAAATAGSAVAGRPTSERLVAKAISAGTDMTCAVLSDDSVSCWGNNDHGQLGDGTITESLVPVRVRGVSNATAVVAGGTWIYGGRSAARSSFGCALLADRSVKCWGSFPDESRNDQSGGAPEATTISGLGNVSAVAGGAAHACALLEGGSVRCWGGDFNGELGNGLVASCRGTDCAEDRRNPTAPVTADLGAAIAISGQGSRGSCAVLSTGAIECWGAFLQTGPADGRPFSIAGVVTNAAGLAAGYSHACAVSPSATVQCWGSNQYGQLGDGTTNGTEAAVSVNGLPRPAVAVTVGGSHSCALLDDATISCWGSGSGSLRPTLVHDLTDVIAVSAGYSHICALIRGGSVRCWGSPWGSVPTPIDGF